MVDIPESILADFRKVRDDTGISISRQMEMHEAGYKIVIADEGVPDICLKCEPHELLEYIGDNEYSLVGNIITKDGEFCSAEIIDDIITTLHDIYMIRAFLNEVEKMIKEVRKDD